MYVWCVKRINSLLAVAVFGLQAEQLVQMICYPGGLPSVQLNDSDDDDNESKHRYHIARILHSVDQWSQRVSWLELQLMIKQALSSVSAYVFFH